MTALTQFAQKKMLDHTIGLASYTMPTVHLALLSSNPGETGSLAGEPATGSYARVALAGKIAATVLATGIAVNSAAIVFPAPTGTWGTMTHWAVCDAATAGNVLVYGALAFSRLVENGSLAPTFLAGAFSIMGRSTLPNEMTQYLAKKWLDHLLGIASFVAPVGVHLGLASSDPGPTGSLTGELVGSGYARQALTAKMAAATLATGIANNSGQVVFPVSSGAWNITHEFIADASIAGNVLWRHGRELALALASGSPALRVDVNQLAIGAQ